MRLDRLDRWLGPCLVLLAVVWLWLSYAYIPGARGEGEPGPRAFPVLLGFLLATLGVLMTITAWTSGRDAAGADTTAPASRREGIIVAATFGLLLLYAFLLDKTGFLIATPVVVVLAMRGILHVRNWKLIIGMAGGLTTGCWLFFVSLLGAPLPRGTWLLWL